MSREKRIGNLEAQQQRPFVARGHEQFVREGDLITARFFSCGLRVVYVWKRVDRAWATVMTQATTDTRTKS